MCRDLMTVGAFPAPAKTWLPPGFRFHPTDEELVSYYLKKKVVGKPCCDAIVEIDINKHEPWELAEYSKLRTREQEWYFFSGSKKNGSGIRVQQGAYVLCKLFLNEPRGNRNAEEEWDGENVRVMADHVPFVINELPRKFETDNDPIAEYPHQQHHDNDKDDDDETPRCFLLFVSSTKKLRCLPSNTNANAIAKASLLETHSRQNLRKKFFLFNKEAPLPLIQYKRNRKTSQDHCPSTAAMAAVLLDFSLTGCSKEEKLLTKENKTESAVTMAHEASSSTKRIKDVHMQGESSPDSCGEREKLKLDLMSAEMIMNLLQGRINALREEKEELRTMLLK